MCFILIWVPSEFIQVILLVVALLIPSALSPAPLTVLVINSICIGLSTLCHQTGSTRPAFTSQGKNPNDLKRAVEYIFKCKKKQTSYSSFDFNQYEKGTATIVHTVKKILVMDSQYNSVSFHYKVLSKIYHKIVDSFGGKIFSNSNYDFSKYY